MKSTISKKSLKSAPTPKIEVTAGPESSKEPAVRVVKSGVCPSLSRSSRNLLSSSRTTRTTDARILVHST
jgi:hypothetical protein